MRKLNLRSSFRRAFLVVLLTLVSSLSFASTLNLSDLHMSANIQTNHLWRGGEVADGLVVTYDAAFKPFGKNLKVGVWGGINGQGTYKEFNYFVTYKIKGFKAKLVDTYNFADYATYNHDDFFDYKPSSTGRFLDASIEYRFPESFPIKISWATVLFGRDRNSDNTHNRFSTFCYAEYPIYNKNSWRVDGGLGGAFALNPMGESANFYGDKAGIVQISLSFSHDLTINRYKLPVSITAMWNPQSRQAHLQLSTQIFSF